MVVQGFIQEYRDFILEHIPTSPEWAESIAASLMSTVIGVDKKLITTIGALPLNVWFLMIGPSGLAKKSTPLKYFVFPLLAEVTRNIDYPIIMPSRMSVEGMIEYMSKGYSNGSIIRDEFTGLFKEVYNKEYLADAFEFMSEMYDGMIQKRYTRKAKLEQAFGVYVTLLSATTPYLYKIMRPDFFVQGTGNRILLCMHKSGKAVEKEDPDIFFNRGKSDLERTEKIERFGKDLSVVRNCSIQYLSPMANAAKLFVEFKFRMDTLAQYRYKKDIYDLNYTYIVRMPEMALKLSGLASFSRYYKTIGKSNLSQLMVNEEDMAWAINKTEVHLRNFELMLENWRLRPEVMAPKTIDDQVLMVVEMLAARTSDGISWGDLRYKARWDSRIWQEVVKYLWDTDQVVFVSKDKSGAGHPTVVLFGKVYEADALKQGTKIENWEGLKFKLKLGV